MLATGYGLIGPAFGSLLIYSVELDWHPLAGVAGRRIQVALTKDRKYCPEDGGNKFLRNIGTYIPVYTASYPRSRICLRGSA